MNGPIQVVSLLEILRQEDNNQLWWEPKYKGMKNPLDYFLITSSNRNKLYSLKCVWIITKATDFDLL